MGFCKIGEGKPFSAILPMDGASGSGARNVTFMQQGGGISVLLVPARTDTAWFHDWVYGKADLRFVRGRLHFNGSKWNAPFPSVIAIYRPE